jgi:hypothetical protein
VHHRPGFVRSRGWATIVPELRFDPALGRFALMDGLPQIDENSSEGKQITAALDSLDKLCATK